MNWNLQGMQADAVSAAALFDYVDDTVFFVKDVRGGYVAINETMKYRCAVNDKQEIIGRTSEEVYPAPLGASYLAQDKHVIETGVPLIAELERHPYRGRREGWCLTWKVPMTNDVGVIVGLSGISRDLAGSLESVSELKKVAIALRHIKSHIGQNIQIEELAKLSELSAFQLDSRIKNLFGLSTGQFITQSRIEYASVRLKNSDEPIVQIARAAGYTDASAFTRQFRKVVGSTPSSYRAQYRS